MGGGGAGGRSCDSYELTCPPKGLGYSLTHQMWHCVSQFLLAETAFPLQPGDPFMLLASFPFPVVMLLLTVPLPQEGEL